MTQEPEIGFGTVSSRRSLFLPLLDRLSKLSRLHVRLLGTFVVILVGILDHVTSVAITASFLYLIPVVFASWYDGRRAGGALAVLGALLAFFSEVLLDIPIPYAMWNAVTRLMIFASVVWMVTEIRQIQLPRLQNQLDRYARIVETAAEGVLVLDQHGHVKYASDRALAMLGYDGEDVRGLKYQQFIHDDASRELIGAVLRDKAGVMPVRMDIQFQRKGGDPLWTLVSAGATRDNGRQLGTVLLITDISERRSAEERLQRKYNEISALQRLSSVLSGSIRFTQPLQDSLQNVIGLFDADAGGIYLVDEENDRLVLEHQIGLSKKTIELAKYWGRSGSTGQAWKSGYCQFVEDAQGDAVLDPRVRSIEQIGAIACVPLETNEKVLGVMNLMYRKPCSFSAEERSMLQAIGRQIGVVLENARLYEEARARERKLQSLSIEMIRMQEDERRRFARELHDGLAQLLTTMRVNAELALQRLGHSGGDVEHYLEELISSVRDAESETKQISYDLRPTILDDFGLKAAIEFHARSFQRRTGIAVDLHLPNSTTRLDSVIETTVYRLVQELLANVSKHSGASQVVLQLLPRSNILALTVSDNGKGFTFKEPFGLVNDRPSSGLRNVRERVESLGGVLRVETAPGKGAEFMIEIPCTLPDTALEKELKTG